MTIHLKYASKNEVAGKTKALHPLRPGCFFYGFHKRAVFR